MLLSAVPIDVAASVEAIELAPKDLRQIDEGHGRAKGVLPVSRDADGVAVSSSCSTCTRVFCHTTLSAQPSMTILSAAVACSIRKVLFTRSRCKVQPRPS